jgi:prepilin-type N-terminal cleavage/methylation domain-containing protein
MNVPSRPRSRGFTLIELLTVLVIISVLMGMLFTSIHAMKEMARKTDARVALTNTTTAIEAYYTEYGKYPPGPGGSGDAVFASAEENGQLMNILRGLDSEHNRRHTVFLTLNDAKNPAQPKSGIDRTTGAYIDPWGQPYRFAVDADYNNRIDTNPVSGGPSPLHRGVIGWSLGKEGDLNKSGVLSWQ